MSDDDLRFGDVGEGSGNSGSGDWLIELFTRIFVGLVLLYVLLSLLKSLYGVPVPFV